LLGNGAIQVIDSILTNDFYWLNPDVGPNAGTLINNLPNKTVNDLPADNYDIRVRYRTLNSAWYSYYIWIFGDANCTDTITYFVPSYSYFDMYCPDDIYITSHQIIQLSGGEPWGGKYYLNGNEITQFNSEEHGNGVYFIRYYYFDESTDCESFCQFKIVVELPANIQKSKNNIFSLYPNPNSGEFTIEFDKLQNANCQIYDVQGRLVFKEQISINQKSKSISLDLNSGVYYLRLLNENGVFTEKFIVQ